MQNSAIYRQGIVLPLDERAEECLRANDVDFSTNVQVLPIPDVDLWADLWRLGLFERINASCGSLIDEYEEEWIDASQVPAVLAAVDRVSPAAQETTTLAFLVALRSMATNALTMSRPLLFVL